MRLNKNQFVGGTACKDQINGSCSDEKTKGAYPDIPLVWKDRYGIIEVDENRHNFYEQSCELARYDTIQFGTDQLKPTKFFRFNPHKTNDIPFTLLEKVKVLIQSVRNYFKAELNPDLPVAYVEYLFYGEVYIGFLDCCIFVFC